MSLDKIDYIDIAGDRPDIYAQLTDGNRPTGTGVLSLPVRSAGSTRASLYVPRSGHPSSDSPTGAAVLASYPRASGAEILDIDMDPRLFDLPVVRNAGDTLKPQLDQICARRHLLISYGRDTAGAWDYRKQRKLIMARHIADSNNPVRLEGGFRLTYQFVSPFPWLLGGALTTPASGTAPAGRRTTIRLPDTTEGPMMWAVQLSYAAVSEDADYTITLYSAATRQQIGQLKWRNRAAGTARSPKAPAGTTSIFACLHSNMFAVESIGGAGQGTDVAAGNLYGIGLPPELLIDDGGYQITADRPLRVWVWPAHKATAS